MENYIIMVLMTYMLLFFSKIFDETKIGKIRIISYLILPFVPDFNIIFGYVIVGYSILKYVIEQNGFLKHDDSCHNPNMKQSYRIVVGEYKFLDKE